MRVCVSFVGGGRGSVWTDVPVVPRIGETVAVPSEAQEGAYALERVTDVRHFVVVDPPEVHVVVTNGA